ncbi:MAG TPA: SAM-dependent methyltransferase [Candidatus Ozemobacteraceae bacterium]|nr:SAM-dependent methyltransferase [Candidatus Ozemobacteraceae bacterium]
MAFDTETRNRLSRMVGAARTLLTEEFTRQLQEVHGIQPDGTVTGLERLTHLSDGERAASRALRDRVAHLAAGRETAKGAYAEAVDRVIREQAFTVLNRFAALRMAEERRLVEESVREGYRSKGFQVYLKIAGTALGTHYQRYCAYLSCLCDEISVDLGVLFDRHSPMGLLFPREPALLALLELIDAADLKHLWAEDETIGWIYQYFNSREERKAMRDASAAPRNSRELAVRNQFFTPRYVVQFLTDNTLGRIWYEMRKGNTRLAEACEFLVVRPGEAWEPRSMKDPRDLRLLDPACGSGHFLLYAYDLLAIMYEEAWNDPEAPASESTGKPLREEYPTLEALRAAVPGLILGRNLHGVDIDPRCAQIAQLSLWLRAQRSFRDAGLSRAARPLIRRTNVVVAEPMPGDAALVEEFAGTLDPPLLGALFKNIVTEMQLAGELGLLLKIEASIAGAVAEARSQFAAREREKKKGYLPGFEPERAQGELDFSGIDDQRFFEFLEPRLVEALHTFVSSAAAEAAGTRRRLFADDALQGLGLVETAGKTYDVVLMNPPFGACASTAKKTFEKSWPKTKNDVYAAFVERGIDLLHPRARLGAITSRTGFFLSSFQKWREEVILPKAPPAVFADLGHGVLDNAMVEVAAYCLEKSIIQ